MDSQRNEAAGLDDDQRFKLIDQLYIITPEIQEINAAIEDCCLSKAEGNDPACILIEGPKGSGKTSLAERIVSQKTIIVGKTYTKVPAFLITIPVNPTDKKITQEILHAVKDPSAFSASHNTHLHTIKASNCVESIKAEIMFCDEFQHFTNRTTHNIIYDSTDWFKNFIKTNKLPTVVMGIEGQIKVIIDSNEQLASLFIGAFVLKNFSWDQKRPETIRYFTTFLQMVDQQLPLKYESMLSEAQLAFDIFQGTDGSKRGVMRLLRKAAKIAIETKKEKIDRAVLSKAFKHVGRGLHNLDDPFVE